METVQQTSDSRAYVARPLVEALERLDRLPVAHLTPVWTQNPSTGNVETAAKKRAIWMVGDDGKQDFVGIVSDRYTLVQHTQAFEPVLNALVQAGTDVDLKARMASNGERAWLDCIVDQEVADSVRLGFRVDSTIDGASSIRYSFSAQQVSRFTEKVERKRQVTAEEAAKDPVQGASYRYIEVVGFRQACSNGMKVRVPLAEAERAMADKRTPNYGVGSYDIRTIVSEVWTEELEREKVTQLAFHVANIRHSATAPELVKQQREAVALMLALRAPVQRLIARAQGAVYPTEQAAFDALCKVAGKSKALDIWTANRQRSPEFFAKHRRDGKPVTAWDLYNAMTFYATHCLPEGSAKEGIEDQAADYLVLLTGLNSPSSSTTGVRA